MKQENKLNKWVGYWLLAGGVMILIQVILGGITRLTGSGLSITEWKVGLGWIPPINHDEWVTAFDKYKSFPQYKLINQEMTLDGFKQIFFWEYFHRLWARLISVVFLLPFIFFLIKGWFTKSIIKPLLILFVLGGLQGFVGWLMVSTGLKDRAWVTPFSLSVHLILATATYAYLLWIFIRLFKNENAIELPKSTVQFSTGLVWLCFIQIMFGGFMAGSHAALNFPTWPSMNGSYLPENWVNTSINFFDNFVENLTFIQFIHRNTAYLLTVLVLFFWWKNRTTISLKAFQFLPVMIILQVLLGIATLILSVSKIPVLWGVLHQLGALILLTLLLITRFNTKSKSLG